MPHAQLLSYSQRNGTQLVKMSKISRMGVIVDTESVLRIQHLANQDNRTIILGRKNKGPIKNDWFVTIEITRCGIINLTDGNRS